MEICAAIIGAIIGGFLATFGGIFIVFQQIKEQKKVKTILVKKAIIQEIDYNLMVLKHWVSNGLNFDTHFYINHKDIFGFLNEHAMTELTSLYYEFSLCGATRQLLEQNCRASQLKTKMEELKKYLNAQLGDKK